MRQSRGRAYRRHHRARVRAAHVHAHYLLSAVPPAWPPRPDVAVRHPRSCGRARCLLCHWGKLIEPRRAREKRAWRGLVERDGL